MKVWAKTEEFSEGKYLVLRRDGTVPRWPHFVLAGVDPAAPQALRAYSVACKNLGLEQDYVQSVLELSDDFEKLADGAQLEAKRLGIKGPDPDKGPHRVDNPFILGMMRGEYDLTVAQGKLLATLTVDEEQTIRDIREGRAKVVPA